MRNKIVFIAILAIAFSISGCNSNSEKAANKNTDTPHISGDLIIFHAGSLSVPLKQIAEAFNTEYPDVNVILESAGSVKCARKISDLHKDCDIMASADYTVIDKILIPEFADWNIQFASNEMSITFHEKSKYANEINAENWHEILLRYDVAYGRSDPNSDPCGYRTVLTTRLAEQYYGLNEFSKKLLEKDEKYIRPKETDLLALLESDEIDYIFLYRSVAEQHGLKYIVLPDSINLKKPELTDFYASVSVDIHGKKQGETITMAGQPMVYGITQIKNAPNPKTATAFLDFFLSEKGQKIMNQNGQPSVAPYKNENYEKIPELLKKYTLN